jgi:hypothetical protein
MHGVEPSTLIDVWTVDPERQRELVSMLADTIRRQVQQREGFVSAEIYESVDRELVVVAVHMRTAADRRELNDSSELAQAYRSARALARSHAHAFRLADSFGVA